MQDTHQPPFLGQPQLVKGTTYIIHERAQTGQTYSILCPVCSNVFTVQPPSAGSHIERCPHCRATFGFKAKDAAPATAAPSAAQVAAKPTDRIHLGRAMRHPACLEWGRFLTRHTAPLREGSTVIGRNDSSQPSDIGFNDDYMSRRSLRIDVQRNPGQQGYLFKLTVMRSANPVFVNSNTLREGEAIYLNYGDTIKAGRTTLTFKAYNK